MTEPSSSRGVFVVAAALVGVAIGLFVYRFVVLGLTWQGGARHVFTGAAIGLGFAARAITKGREGRPAAPLLVGGAVLGAGVALGIAFLLVPPLGRARLTTHELPGFTIDLPSGEVAEQHPDYLAGKLLLKQVAGSGGVVAVQWEAGEPVREDLELAMTALGSSVGASSPPTMSTLPGPGGAAVDTATLDTPKGPARMTWVPCAKRRILVMTMGTAAMESVHERIVPTVRCRPDPAREPGEPGRVALHLELPGWYAIERQPMMVTVSDGVTSLTLRQLAGGKPQDLRAQMPALFQAMGGAATMGPSQGDLIPLSGTLEGEAFEGWVRQVLCPRANVIVFAISPDRASADHVAALATTARCLRQDEPLPAWPDEPAAEPASEPAAPADP